MGFPSKSGLYRRLKPFPSMKISQVFLRLSFLLLLPICAVSHAQHALPFIEAEGAEQLLVDNEENIILLYPEEAILKKYLAPSYDSVLVYGGASQLQDGMVHPIKVVLFSRQDIYILDEAVQQFILLNKDFSEVGRISLQDEAFTSYSEDLSDGFQAIDFTIGPGGAVYLLNQLDAQIYKFNSFTGIEWVFGGVNYGEGSLEEPTTIGRDDQIIYVYDQNLSAIKLYDLYGNYLSKHALLEHKAWEEVARINEAWLWWGKEGIWVETERFGKTAILQVNTSLRDIRDIYLFKNKLYVISKNQVHLQDISASKEE